MGLSLALVGAVFALAITFPQTLVLVVPAPNGGFRSVPGLRVRLVIEGRTLFCPMELWKSPSDL